MATPTDVTNQINAQPWTNKAGLISGATVSALLLSIVGLFANYAPVNGTPVSGNCLKWTASLGVTDAGQACGSGAGGNPGPYTMGTAITGTGTIAASNTAYCVNLSGAAALTLPAAPATGARIVLKDCTGAMTATVAATITPSSGNIDGQANFVMNTAYQANGFFYSGTQWSVE